MPGAPDVSVLMPVYRPDPRFFPPAVASVLDQTFESFELLIVERPCSGPGVLDLLPETRDPRVRRLEDPETESPGLTHQLNLGLAAARASLIARFDADDLCAPRRLERQWNRMREQPEITVLGTGLELIDDAGGVVGRRGYPPEHDDVLAAFPYFNPLAHPSVVFRRGPVLAVGGYQRQGPAQDYDLWSRLAGEGARFANLHQELLRYRVHPEAVKAIHLRQTLKATLEVKRTYWWRAMGPWARLRWHGEWMLQWFPGRWVHRAFLRWVELSSSSDG